ncbi:MAG TPA: hypothetical protein PL155_01020 [Candidatus Omnitrophota bacterium]|nr:hypothetical protein [Candidatus Omnitrophota bacterium]HPD84933.1 hypothetical protein [Candidatus Omnitrophota bacterium]HRZ03791.1 hypothetical protein [Candidatus Omnitrophota bacterium]
MTEAAKRRVFLRTSKFQRPILHIFVFSALAVVAALSLAASYLCYDMTNALMATDAKIPTIKIAILLGLMIMPVVFLFIIIWAYRVSNHLVGAFERILKELDEVIGKNEKRHLKARKGDHLAEELLTRVNVLIDRAAK